MADGNHKSSVVSIEIPESIDNAVKNLTDKPTETVGQVLSDCLFLVFGGINQKAELRRIEYAHNLKQFAKELEKKVEIIPNEKRLDPNIHTICTAMDSMKYCVEESELRNMFTTLIANSMNIDYSDMVHPSFGEIIRQLTPFDAKVILWLKNQEVVPIISFRVYLKDKNQYVQGPFAYLSYDFDDLERLQVSLENLSRNKIIDIHYEKAYSENGLYEQIRQTSSYLNDRNDLGKKVTEDQKIVEKKGSIEITQFGQRFMSACCAE